MRALVVEDQKEEAEAIEKIVAKIQDTEGVWCSTAEEAFLLLKTQKFDLFILDVQLPGVDGFSLANQIRSQREYQLTPILFVTGSDRNPLEAFRKYHCYDYIEKPFSQQELRDKLSALIHSIAYEKQEEAKHKGPNPKQELVCISSRNEDFYLRKEHFLFAEMRNGHAIFHLTDKTVEKSGVSLLGILEDFNDEFIIRCHKSFAINIRNVQFINPINYRLWSASFAQTEEKADIGRRYYDAVHSAIQKLSKQIVEDQ